MKICIEESAATLPSVKVFQWRRQCKAKRAHKASFPFLELYLSASNIPRYPLYSIFRRIITRLTPMTRWGYWHPKSFVDDFRGRILNTTADTPNLEAAFQLRTKTDKPSHLLPVGLGQSGQYFKPCAGMRVLEQV